VNFLQLLAFNHNKGKRHAKMSKRKQDADDKAVEHETNQDDDSGDDEVSLRPGPLTGFSLIFCAGL
jgi:hypothetical protein